MQPGNVPSVKVLTTALCIVLPMTVALLMKACATAWPTVSIIVAGISRGTHSRVAERTRLFPVREYSGKY